MVKRIVVTPTRIVCLPATPVASNRLLRRYGNQFEFIIVAFREEQLQKLQEISTLKRVRSFIENGITIIKHYWFFCASASQLRDHKAYFVAAESFVEVMYEFFNVLWFLIAKEKRGVFSSRAGQGKAEQKAEGKGERAEGRGQRAKGRG